VIRISPDKALRFSNLYSRLLTQKILSQKWAVLYLLYQLSESDAPDEALAEDAQHQLGSKSRPESRLSEAMARSGLQQIPLDEGMKGSYKGSKRSTEFSSTTLKQSNGGPAKSRDMYSPSESALLRDLPFSLQGLASSTSTFSSNDTMKLPSTLPAPLISLLRTLAEPSLLYRGLSVFISSSGGGLVGQSLRSAIADELRSYLTLVATLEGEIRRASKSLELDDGQSEIRSAGVTLRRCVVWTREATLGLRLMTLIVDEAKGMLL
jgi:gamma-tubulin complex component 3